MRHARSIFLESWIFRLRKRDRLAPLERVCAAILRAPATRWFDDFWECDEAAVDLIKATLLSHCCAPEHRATTSVRLYPPCKLDGGDDKASIMVLFTRGGASVTHTTVVDEASGLYVFSLHGHADQTTSCE